MTNKSPQFNAARNHMGAATHFDSLTPDQHLAAAQVEATLYLAEQQRTANLISLASLAERQDIHEELEAASHLALWTLLTYVTVEDDPDTEVVVFEEDIAATLGTELDLEEPTDEEWTLLLDWRTT